ncbi:MAG: DUF7347 domain-containing protein [Promethearchaeota archaeon]
MAIVKSRKRTLISNKSQVENKKTFQVRIDHIFLAMTNSIRVAILRFLNRAREHGPQSFTNIANALKSINRNVSTANLGYHLGEMKKIKLLEHFGSDKNGGYLISKLGRKLVDVYFELQGINDELEILQPNDYSYYVYKGMIDHILESKFSETHVPEIRALQRIEETPLDNFLTTTRSPENARKKVKGHPGSSPIRHHKLDSFL